MTRVVYGFTLMGPALVNNSRPNTSPRHKTNIARWIMVGSTITMYQVCFIMINIVIC